MKPLPQNYSSKDAEKRWQDSWEKAHTYGWRDDRPRNETFVIDTPPPTVSGVLHMGHIFSYTQADFVARYQRMCGKDVFYPMGFDDNGLPTERLVEKTKKIRATDLPREEFIKVCQEVVKEAEDEFRALFKSVALSVDWKQEYQTISAESRKLSQMSFLDLFKKDRAYRQLQPMFWDPVDQTAIAQAEIEDKELPSQENYILFGLVEKETGKPAGEVKIMTTRPELIPACVAVMCDPGDAGKYEGLEAVTPLFGVRVPIIPDEKVDKEKGTGVVMCCTFGDETDIHWWRKHKLGTRIVLNKYGKLDPQLLDEALKEAKDKTLAQELANKKCSNKDPKHLGARERILELLKEKNLLKEQKDITHAVKCAERSGAPLEILPTHQWFVKILDKKKELKAKADECHWFPEYMKLRIHQWIDGLNWDWCISRQRYFGVPFPVWYVRELNKGEWVEIPATKGQLPINPLVDLPDGCIPIAGAQRGFPQEDTIVCVARQDLKNAKGEIVFKGDNYTHLEVKAEKDVMDTWATSSVSPQLSSKAITKEFAIDYQRHEKLFPADLRPQAHEIIRTWAFYTIVKAYLHENTIPWKNLMISGWCLASDKTKMSKSKGNVVTPVELIQSKGADSVRYWASTSRLGSDTAFSEDVLKIGNKLVTKLWNAARFVSAHLEKLPKEPVDAHEDVKAGTITETLDRWILTRLSKATEKATKEFERFEYCDARVAVEDFFWNDFCDNYLEMVKMRTYGEEGVKELSPKQKSAIHTIYHCLEGVLRLFAPIVPHITEELYSHIFEARHGKAGSIHARGMWPEAAEYPRDARAEGAGIISVEILNLVRKAKADRNVSLKWPLDVLKVAGEKEKLAGVLDDLAGVTNAAKVEWAEQLEGAEVLATLDGAFKVEPHFSEKSDAA
jgi:valyl-tRNA synthetase